MLLELDDFISNLRCPKSGCKLVRKENKLIAIGNDQLQYEIIDGRPILVDFDRSILNKDTLLEHHAISPIKRKSYRGFRGEIKKLFEPPRRKSILCINRIIFDLDKLTEKPRVLIIGGGSIGYLMESFYTNPKIALISFDIYSSPFVQFIGDSHNIPIETDFFDCVIIQTVLEHVLEPHIVVKEIARVLKTGGIVYSETPFMQHVHEGAYDFSRFTESGHRYLFQDFDHLDSGTIGGVGIQLLWSIEIFTRGLFRSKKIGKLFKLLLFWLKYFDLIIPAPYSIDAASCVFFLGRKQDNRICPKDIVKYYKGAQ